MNATNIKECYCVTKKKLTRGEKTKPQTAMVITFWFWGLVMCTELYGDWSLHNQHFSGVNDFLNQTAKLLKTLSLRYLVRRWYLKSLGGKTLLAEHWMAPIPEVLWLVRKLGFKRQLELIYWENWTGIWFTQYCIKLPCMEAHEGVLDCHFSWTNLVIYVFYPGSVNWLILICFDVNPWVV